MAQFQLLKSECVPLTINLAQEFQDMAPSPTERELDPRRVRHLREKAEAGLLVTFHWAKANFNGKWMRMNGQHSSSMLCELNGEFPHGLYAHIDEYQVDGAEGLALLFRQFDDRKSSRTPRDVAGAYQGLYPALASVARDAAKLAVEGVVWWRRSIEGQPVPSGDSQYTLFGELGLHSFIQWIGEVFTTKTPELRRAQIASSMYATFIANESEARRFWELVAKGGQEFDDADPTRQLSCWFVRARLKGAKRPPKAAEFYQAGIYAWNAHREGRMITSIRPDTKKGWLTPHQ